MKRKKRLIIFLLLALFLLVVYTKTVYAKESFISIADSCSGYLGDPTNKEDTAYWVQLALNVMRYLAIIILIVMSSIDYIKAVVVSDADALKKANTTFVKRLIYCVLIFFAPIIVEILLSFIGAYGTCGIK